MGLLRDCTTGCGTDGSICGTHNPRVCRCEVSTVVDSLSLTRHLTVVTQPPAVLELPSTLGAMEGEVVMSA